jgi:hypothetical protein
MFIFMPERRLVGEADKGLSKHQTEKVNRETKGKPEIEIEGALLSLNV